MKSVSLVIALAFYFSANLLVAEDFRVSGHAKLQGSFYDRSNHFVEDGDFRLNSAYAVSNFEFSLDSEMLATNQNTTSLISDRRRVADLTADILDSADSDAVLRLDRAFIGYKTDDFKVRVGRQAITWGNGLVFSAMDLFNPFSPVAIDKDYKTGDDMLYSQISLSSEADLQLMAIGRRSEDSKNLRTDESSFAAKLHTRSEDLGLDLDLMAGKHIDREVFGLGASREVASAIARIDLVLQRFSASDTQTSLVANIDRSWILWEKNFYGYIEYFRNGPGETESDYATPNPDLVAQLSNGEVYTLGTDYIAIGGRVELTPLLNLYLNQIFNLHDGSGFSQGRLEYSAAQNLFIIAGFNVPYGDKGSEYSYTQGTAGYLKTSYYF